jgi:hypothetical protein
MRVFGFDLLSYPQHPDQLEVDGALPYPFARRHVQPAVAAQAYREHLHIWARMEELGFDGSGGVSVELARRRRP